MSFFPRPFLSRHDMSRHASSCLAVRWETNAVCTTHHDAPMRSVKEHRISTVDGADAGAPHVQPIPQAVETLMIQAWLDEAGMAGFALRHVRVLPTISGFICEAAGAAAFCQLVW